MASDFFNLPDNAINTQVFYTKGSGTDFQVWTKPMNVKFVHILCIGSGGGGGSASMIAINKRIIAIAGGGGGGAGGGEVENFSNAMEKISNVENLEIKLDSNVFGPYFIIIVFQINYFLSLKFIIIHFKL